MFKNRKQAGILLAKKVKKEIDELHGEVVVLGLARGGMPIASQIAKELEAPLDVLVVKKIGAPGHEELAIGAVGETSGAKYLDKKLAKDVGASKDYLEDKIESIKELIKKREKKFRGEKEAVDLKDKIVIIADDGAATGSTIIAGIREVWNNNPKRVVVALPVLAKDTLSKLEKEADEVIFLEAPETFFAVGQFYQSFPQISDEEVLKLLQ
jgi:putative phosphoribosyl transferase